MAALLESQSEQDMRDLSLCYAALRPAVAPTPAAGSTEAGKKLYLAGDVARGVPGCQGCHGDTGRGPPAATGAAAAPVRSVPRMPRHTIPTLAGQHAQYVVGQLKAYRDGTRLDSSNDRIMQGVVQNLDDADFEAIAAYLAQLPL